MDCTDKEACGQHGPENPGRRRACEACIGGMALLSAGMVGFPVVSFLARPESLELSKPLEVPLDRLLPGQAHYAEHGGQQLILLVTNEGPAVFNASCPHLGCNVIWDPADAVFRCPCHGAIFDTAGKVVRGPVSAPLARVKHEVKDSKLIIPAEV